MMTLYDKWWREKIISFVTNLNVFYCKNNKMVRTCSVPGCRSESYSGCNISFYSFPKNENIKIKWQKNLNITRPITKFSKVCSLHFDPTSFYTPNSLRLLKKDAIPIPAVVLLTVAACSSQKSEAILRDDFDSPAPDGSYKWAIQTEGGIFHEQRGSFKSDARADTPPSLVVEGQYQYTAPDGQIINVLYRADETGFQAEGAHLPTPPPVPPAIQRALRYIASRPTTTPPYDH